MHLDVTELRDFYEQPLGIAVRRLIRNKLHQTWPDVRGMTVLGIGFAAPFLGAFRGDALRLGAVMPAAQGVIMWPSKGPYQSALVEESCLPFSDSSVERVLIAHSLEMTESAKALLREVWRILAPEGRVIVIVPNRRGLWARFDTTPFGYGQPFSRGQIRRRLQSAMFHPVEWSNILFMPPFHSRFVSSSVNVWEKIGARVCPAFSGLLMVEARKEIYATTARTKVKVVPGFSPVPASSYARFKSGR